MTIKKLEKGFTIVELLVALAILSIIMFFLSYIGIYHFQTYNTESAELTITNDGRSSLDDIDNYVRQARRVASSHSSYTTDTDTLVLQLQSINDSNQFIAGTYDNVVFYLSSGVLYRQVFPDVASSRVATTKILARNIDPATFSFTYDNVDYSLVKQITTTMTINQRAGTQTRSITLSSQSTLRNY